MGEKIVKGVAFGLVFVFLLSVTIGMASALSNAGGGDWKYYEEITVKENSGKTLTDFQVLIELNSANFDCSKAKSGDKAAELAKKDMAKELDNTEKYSPISISSAKSNVGLEIPEDYYDDTIEGMGCNPDPASIMGYDDIKALDKPLNEPVKIPDEITDMVKRKVYIDNGKTKVGAIKISPTDLAVWMSVASEETKLIKPYLVYLDTDGDGLPEELAAVYNYPYKDTLFFDDFSDIKGHYKFIPYGYVETDFGVVINPFDIPEKNLGNLCELVYIENPDKIRVLPDKTIPWKDAIGKTPRELGLDKYDRFVSKIPEAPDEVPTGEEVTPTPGFEVGFAIAGLLAVAYIFRRRK